MDTGTALQIYRLMFANIRDGLVIVRLVAGGAESSARVVEMNPVAMQISHQVAGDFRDHNLFEHFPGLRDAGLQRSLSLIDEQGGFQDLGELPAGSNCYRVQLFALFDSYLGLYFGDITEQKKAQAEIAQLLAKAQEDAAHLDNRVADRTAQLEEINAELDAFAYSVSHDLRAPIRTMHGYAEIMLENPEQSEPERVEYLKRILAAAQRMDRLIRDLLAYSRLSRQDIMLQTVSLEHVVRDAAEQLELASGGKSYWLDISGKFPDVMGHHVVLVQVVLNLLSNAIKFVRKGMTPKLRIWAEQEDDLCRLFVEDNGIGIPPQYQERIFKIFERLHGVESYPGSGLGLAIVRKAVARLGGRIGVESLEGNGSRFWIELRKGGG